MKDWNDIVKERRSNPVYRSRVDAEKAKARDELTEYQLAELRRILGLTQEELAARMGADQSRVSRVEHGSDLKLSTLQAYVEALGGTLRITAEIPGEESRVLAL